MSFSDFLQHDFPASTNWIVRIVAVLFGIFAALVISATQTPLVNGLIISAVIGAVTFTVIYYIIWKSQ